MRLMSFIMATAACVSGSMATAGTTLSAVDGICTDPVASYDQRTAALADAGFVQPVSDALLTDALTSDATLLGSLIGMMQPGPELDAMIAQAGGAVASLKANPDVSVWRLPDDSAILYTMLERSPTTAALRLTCKYVGTTAAGSRSDMMATSRYADIMHNEAVTPAVYTADPAALQAAQPKTGWTDMAIMLIDDSARSDAAQRQLPVRFPVTYTSQSILLP